MGRGVAIAFCLAVFTANVIEAASLAGLPSYDEEAISDVTPLIVGGDEGEGLTDIPVDLLGGVTGGDGDSDNTVESILEGKSGEDGGLDSTVGSVLGSDDLTDSLIEDTVGNILGILTGDGDLITLESILGEETDDEDLDSTVESILGGMTGDGDLDSTLESILEEVNDDGDLDSTLESILGGMTGDGDLDSTLESNLEEMTDDGDLDSTLESFLVVVTGDGDSDSTVESILEGETGDGDLDSTGDPILGRDVLTDLMKEEVFGKVTAEDEDVGTTVGSVLGVDVGDLDLVLGDMQDESNDDLLSGVTDIVDDVVESVEPVLESVIDESGSELPANYVCFEESVDEMMISSGGGGDITEALNPSGSIVEGTTNTVTDAAGNLAEGTTSFVLSNPRAVKVLVPVLRKLMMNKSTLEMLVKLAVVERLKKAKENC